MTSRELGKLARHIIQTYPEFYKLYGEREFTWNKIRQYNRNPLLAMNIGADGLKTGFTKEAGYGLVGSAVQNGLRLIVVVNGLRDAKRSAPTRARSCSNGASTISSPGCCSPKARRSRRPRSMAARRGTCRWSRQERCG